MEQIASAFDLIVHLDRLIDGTRKVVFISEVQGMEGEVGEGRTSGVTTRDADHRAKTLQRE